MNGDHLGAWALLALAAGITAWCVRAYRREQATCAALLAERPGLYLEGDPYAAVAAYEARHLDLELWLETRGLS